MYRIIKVTEGEKTTYRIEKLLRPEVWRRFQDVFHSLKEAEIAVKQEINYTPREEVVKVYN